MSQISVRIAKIVAAQLCKTLMPASEFSIDYVLQVGICPAPIILFDEMIDGVVSR